MNMYAAVVGRDLSAARNDTNHKILLERLGVNFGIDVLLLYNLSQCQGGHFSFCQGGTNPCTEILVSSPMTPLLNVLLCDQVWLPYFCPYMIFAFNRLYPGPLRGEHEASAQGLIADWSTGKLGVCLLLPSPLFNYSK